LTQQIDLKEVIGKHNKDDLVDNHREGPGGKMGQVAKAFVSGKENGTKYGSDGFIRC
jgi:hypothetical protein